MWGRDEGGGCRKRNVIRGEKDENLGLQDSTSLSVS